MDVDREDASVPELIAHVRELFRKNTKSKFYRYLFGKEKLKPTREEAFSNEVDPTNAAHYLDRLRAEYGPHRVRELGLGGAAAA
ncbi:MAG TPA: hypothetical protein VN903_11790 [Polyangia bacterium]|nr:hypothetical protein [Polyangia bacterium]